MPTQESIYYQRGFASFSSIPGLLYGRFFQGNFWTSQRAGNLQKPHRAFGARIAACGAALGGKVGLFGKTHAALQHKFVRRGREPQAVEIKSAFAQVKRGGSGSPFRSALLPLALGHGSGKIPAAQFDFTQSEFAFARRTRQQCLASNPFRSKREISLLC